MSPNNGGPPDKWVKFAVSGLSSDEVLAKLNDLAEHDINSVAVSAQCTDGPFIFVGGYASE